MSVPDAIAEEAAGLSAGQRETLAALLHYLRHAERQPAGLARDIALQDGAPMRWLRPRGNLAVDDPRPRAESAAFSRAVARLERRGLVLRKNVSSGVPGTGKVRTSSDQPHTRADHLMLTEAGRKVAEWLDGERDG
jgi:hypothetical protein